MGSSSKRCRTLRRRHRHSPYVLDSLRYADSRRLAEWWTSREQQTRSETRDIAGLYDDVPDRNDALSGQDVLQSGQALLAIDDVESVHAPQPNLFLELDHERPKEMRCRLGIGQAFFHLVLDFRLEQRPLRFQGPDISSLLERLLVLHPIRSWNTCWIIQVSDFMPHSDHPLIVHCAQC